MDSGSYNNVRRGGMPSSSSAPSYKANVNRTKTRKWVEAKVQSYDGDDWGNDFEDEYDDGDDQQHDADPEPPPPPPPVARPAGPRQLGPAGHHLPSSRTFSQPSAASLPSNTNPRLFGSSALRSSGGPPSLHVQTQSPPPSATSQPYATESAYPTTTSSHTNVTSGPYSAGPAATPSRFPPRKSSMGQQDRPDLGEKTAPRTDSRPGSSSNNRPWLDQRPASPSRAPLPTAKTMPLVRPSDIYKRIGEERGKERLSMESGRPSLDSLPGRAEDATPGQSRLSGEQRRRTSFDSHDGSDSARAPRSTLEPVAERRSEYGMDGFLIKAPAGLSPVLPGPAASNPELSKRQSGPSDEVKADLMKSRRFSTSPQLPILTRVSGFGDDFFSGSSGFSSQTSPRLLSPEEEPRSLRDEMDAKTAPIESDKKQTPNAAEEAIAGSSSAPTAGGDSNAAREEAIESAQLRPSSTRPQLPGGWVSENLSISAPSGRSTPMEKQEARGPADVGNLQSVSVSMAENVAENPSSPPTIDATKNAPDANGTNRLGAGEPGSAAGQHGDATSSDAQAPGEHYAVRQSLPPLQTDTPIARLSSRPTSTGAPAAGDEDLQMPASSSVEPITGTVPASEFSPTAPLNPNRIQAGQPDIILPETQLRKSTISTIETISPEKESDKLREEIIKSLSPAPISPGSSNSPGGGDFGTEPTPGDLTRESTYLSGVYDDYLSLGEEKSLQEVSQAAKESKLMAPSPSAEAENGTASQPRDVSAAQPAPLSSARSTPSEDRTRPRRFSWQQGPEEVTLSPIESKPAVPVFSQESLAYSQDAANAESSTKMIAVSPISDSLQADSGATGSISHQVSDVSSRGPEGSSLTAIESPSPVSLIATRPLKPASDERNQARLSLADEKEKVLIGDAQSIKSNVSEQHPALAEAPERNDDIPSPVFVVPNNALTESQAAPTPFREILNLPTYEQRVQKFDETREQFYVIDSGLSNWLNYIQSQPEHTDAVASYNASIAAHNASSFLSKPGSQPASGTPGGPQPPYKTGTAASHPRRSSIGNMQQLMAGSSGGFGASGAQVGTKSKELFHAAGAFGNKGMKSGMKLFNKGKNKLRERAAGDKTFF